MLEAYAVGVRVSLIDKATGGLLSLSRAFAKAHGDAAKLQKQLDAIRFKMIAGAGIAGAGFLGFMALRPALEQAKLLQQAQAKFSTFGMGAAANANAFHFAQGMNIAGSTYVDNMNRMIEAQGVFRESGKLTLTEQLRGAKLAAPLLAKIDFSNSVLNPDMAASRHASALSMLRFIETRGGINNPADFNRIANLGYKAIQGSGGNVSWELYRQFMATGASAAQGLSDKALYGEFEPIIGELKGRAGTALATAYNRLQGITKVPNQVAHLFVDSGIWRKNDVIWNSLGGVKRFGDNKSPLTDSAMYQSDPVAWYQKTMLPLYSKMGLDQAGRTRENAVIFGRTGGLLFNLIDRQLPAITNSLAAWAKSMGIDQSYKVAGNTAIGQELKMRAEIKNIEASMGMAILPMYVRGLKELEPLLWAVSTWTRQHPRQLQYLMYAFTGLSASMAFGGSVLLLKGAFDGLRLATVPLSWGLVRVGLGANAATAGLMRFLGPIGVIAGLVGGGLTMRGKLQDQLAKHGREWHWWYDVPGGNLFIPGIIRPLDKPYSSTMSQVNLTPWTPRGQGASYQKADLVGAFREAMKDLHVQMDGKQVGRIVSAHQGKEAVGPSTGPAHYDPRMTPMLAGGAY